MVCRFFVLDAFAVINFTMKFQFLIPTEHDDREDFSAKRDNKFKGRRVTFKQTRGGGGGRGRFSEMAIRQHLDNDDDMSGDLGLSTKVPLNIFDCTYSATALIDIFNPFQNIRGRGPIRRRSSPPPRGGGGMKNFGRRRLTAGTSGWFQVKVPFGAKVGKTEIYALILQHIRPMVFIPHYYKELDNASIFYVDDLEAAQKLSDSDRQIQMPSGHPMRLLVTNNVPQSNVDDSVVQRMKLAMVKRYNAETKALDLTKFHSDPDLLDIFCALFRPSFMTEAFKIIAENIPQLEALSLNDNKISVMTHFSELAAKVPNLKVLYLSKNKVSCLR